ncbi:hypothetical protein D1AOALGA4SA_6528 [Olavius algarvensis Delta 1 endosymbiont]|nr:hypothetical protein D1AOALGA4SA_6528 [Olavius algarvensis Delta 1 endosymbiont]
MSFCVERFIIIDRAQRLHQSAIRNPQSEMHLNPKSAIRNPQCELIRNPKCTLIRNPKYLLIAD